MTDPTTPRRDLGPREYLGAAFEPSDRLAILVRNRRRGETVQRIATAGRIVEPSFLEWLHFKNEREGFDVYVGMNPLKPAARTRTKEDILSIRHLYVDLDHDGPKSLAAITQSNLVPRPNYILSTSPDKFHAIWRVQEVAHDQAEALLRAMARKFGGDPAATDSTRILRVPGFGNRKYDEEFVVKAKQHSHRIHHSLDFKLRIEPVDSTYQPAHHAPVRAPESGPRQLTQSAHDWAFAKRALAGGADPETVIRNIAQFREHDKHDSLDYARRTVAKAQTQLNSRPARFDVSPDDAADTKRDQ
jgi:hypothetical protein